MNEIIYTDELSGIDKNITISPPIPFDAKTDGVFNFFVDDQRLRDMFETLSKKALTTKDLQHISTQIQTSQLKESLDLYILKLRYAEKSIIYFLEKSGYISKERNHNKASIVFSNETIELLPENLFVNIDFYLQGKGYFEKEFQKMDDENGVYKIVIEVKYEENDSYIENITLEKI